jgi:MoxR-like ATPase
MVLATQNPIEQEGTYPLPEAQMDRFLMHITMTYPDDASEKQIVGLVRDESSGEKSEPPEIIPQDAVFAAQDEIQRVTISAAMEDYLVAIIAATRRPQELDQDLGRWIQVGASPRGSIGLDKASRAHAWWNDREHVTPDDLRAIAHDCLRHRLILSYEANADGISPDEVITRILKLVAVA